MSGLCQCRNPTASSLVALDEMLRIGRAGAVAAADLLDLDGLCIVFAVAASLEYYI